MEAVKDTLRYGLFLGSFAGTYVSVDECVAAIGGDSRHVTCSFSVFTCLLAAKALCLLIWTRIVNFTPFISIFSKAGVLDLIVVIISYEDHCNEPQQSDVSLDFM